jgi:hypothetical protein
MKIKRSLNNIFRYPKEGESDGQKGVTGSTLRGMAFKDSTEFAVLPCWVPCQSMEGTGQVTC